MFSSKILYIQLTTCDLIHFLTDVTVGFEQSGPIDINENAATVNVALEIMTQGMLDAGLTVQVEIHNGSAGIATQKV